MNNKYTVTKKRFDEVLINKMEKRVMIAFYKGWSSRPIKMAKHASIRLLSFSKYSHCEFVLEKTEKFGKSMCWSASSKRGVTKEQIRICNKDWDILEVAVPIKDCIERFQKIEGAKYSYIGAIIASVYCISKSRSKRWFCSEAVYFALTGRRHRIGVKALYKHLSQLETQRIEIKQVHNSAV